MAAGTAELSKVDSAVGGMSPSDDKKVGGHKRTSSSNPDVHNINDLEKEGTELKIAPETQKLDWKMNTSPTAMGNDDLKKPLTTPLVKKIDLVFPLGMEVTARNMKGVTIKDALDAIYKQYKKKKDDELEEPILAGFEWDKETSWTKLKIHMKKEGAPQSKSAKKAAKKAGGDDE